MLANLGYMLGAWRPILGSLWKILDTIFDKKLGPKLEKTLTRTLYWVRNPAPDGKFGKLEARQIENGAIEAGRLENGGWSCDFPYQRGRPGRSSGVTEAVHYTPTLEAASWRKQRFQTSVEIKLLFL